MILLFVAVNISNVAALLRGAGRFGGIEELIIPSLGPPRRGTNPGGSVAPVTRRRRVDWSVILGPQAPVPRRLDRAEEGNLAGLLAAFDELLAIDDPEQVLQRAVTLGLKGIGLERVGLFLIDRSRNLMLGTWGTDLHGNVVDEHQIMYEVTDTDREAFRRAEEEGAHFTVFENCPIVEHRPGETLVEGRGWVACTPIRSARASIGMMFNDTAISGAPVDEAKQAHAAILCSLLGTILDPVRGTMGRNVARRRRLRVTGWSPRPWRCSPRTPGWGASRSPASSTSASAA